MDAAALKLGLPTDAHPAFEGQHAPALVLGLFSRLLARRQPDCPPQTVITVDYAPHSLVMPRARALVHQGGVGTTGQAFRAGQPMLIMPFGQDQPDNARRAVGLGVSRTLARTNYTPRRVASELSQLLRGPTYAAHAAQVGRQVRLEDGAGVAATTVQNL